MRTVAGAEKARVWTARARVRRYAAFDAPVMAVLRVGRLVEVSTRVARDPYGFRWRRVLLPSGDFGFVLANQLTVLDPAREQFEAGIDPRSPEPVRAADSRWNFAIRAMALGGYRFEPRTTLAAYEGEASVCVPIPGAGFDHRRVSVGVAYVPLKEQRVVAGTLIYRVFPGGWGGLAEPEVRFRAGRETATGRFAAGLNLGVRYPLRSRPGAQVAAYAEWGSLDVPDLKKSLSLWGAAGLGFHF